jgi:protein-disulfide isomerase
MCALALTTVVVKQRWDDRARAAPRHRVSSSEWKALAAAGGELGSVTAKDTIVVLTDYQCPFCARLDPLLDSLATKPGASLLVRIRQLPNQGSHAFAYRSATLSVCAEERHTFAAVHRRLFRESASFTDSSFQRLERDIVRADSALWTECIRGSAAASRIARDIELAQRLEVHGTPAVFVNGWELRGPWLPLRFDSLFRVH